MKNSIAKKLTVYFLFLSLLSTTIVGFYSFNKAQAALIERTYEQLISVRAEKITRLNNFFNQRLKDVTFISEVYQDLTDTNLEKANLLDYLKGYLQAGNYYRQMFIVENGYLLDVNLFTSEVWADFEGDLISKKNVFEPMLLLHDKSEPFLFECEGLHEGHRSTLLVGVKLNSEDLSRDVSVLLELNLQTINEIMFDNNPHNGLGESGEAYLVGADKLIRSNSRFQDNAPFNTVVNTVGVEKALQGITGKNNFKDYRGIKVFSSYSPYKFSDLDWAILAEIDVQEAFIPIYNIRNNIIYLSLLIALLLIGVVAVLANMIAAPLKKLKQETELITQGIYGKTIREERTDEIGSLISAFNTMTVQLKEHQEKLELERVLRLSSMIDGQELERQRLSRELHDSLGQLIVAIKMKLEQAINSNDKKAREILVETQQLFAATAKEIRVISNNLMPAVLNEFGLVTGLRNLCAEVEKIAMKQISFIPKDAKDKYSKRIDTYLYRIAQEALNNAVKHSEASVIDISLEDHNNELVLDIVDNGVGYSSQMKSGNGISNMRERANLLGGHFEILNLNPGTEVKVNIPI